MIAVIVGFATAHDHSKAGIEGSSGTRRQRVLREREGEDREAEHDVDQRLDEQRGEDRRRRRALEPRAREEDLDEVAAARRRDRVDADASEIGPGAGAVAVAHARIGGAQDRVPGARAQQQVERVQRERDRERPQLAPPRGGRGRRAARRRMRRCCSTCRRLRAALALLPRYAGPQYLRSGMTARCSRSGTTSPTTSARRSQADSETDVLVIGAGIAGLSCAWHLAERGVDCTVVEARTAAGGASGRNGGFLVAGAAPAHQDAVRAVRARGRARHLPRDARIRAADLRDRRRDRRERALRARRLPARHVGAGGARARARPVRGDARRRPAGRVGRRGRPAARSCGGPAASACSPRPTRRCTRRAGCGPSRARSRSAACASSSAARCPSRSRRRATAASRSPAGGGTVHAQRVVVAADGALPQLVPYYAPAVRTKRLHMVATAPLAERVVPVRDRRALGLRVLPAAARRAHRRGRVLRSRRRRARPTPTRRSSSRRPRSMPASSASCATTSASQAPVSRTAGSGSSATRATSARSSARCPDTTGSTSRAATTAPAISTASPPAASSASCSPTGDSADAHLYDSARPLSARLRIAPLTPAGAFRIARAVLPSGV